MDNNSLTADKIIHKIKHFLISNYGKTESKASIEEFYRAFCIAVREEIMINWTANLQTMQKEKKKILYYISLEYLPGKLMANNITNIGCWNIVHEVLAKTNRSLVDLVSCDVDPGLGNGGLGRLSSCFLDSLATQKYPAFGYGLRYQYGIFEQEIWNGKQVERPDCWLLKEYPWEMRKDVYAKAIHFGGKVIPATNRHGDAVYHLQNYEEVRALPYDIPIVGYSEDDKHNVLSLRLWTTKESPRNFELQRYNAGQIGPAGENTSLTDVLYPNDNHEVGKRIRLKQEFLLVSASLQDIIARHLHWHEDITSFKEKVQIQINDTHPALMIPELTRRLIMHHDMSFTQAWETTQQCCNYTNHTILKESLEEWNEKRLQNLLPRQYKMIQKLNEQFCNEVRHKFPNNEEKIHNLSFIENGQIKMAHLSIYGCKKTNGVSQLHGEILRNKVFKDFAQMYPEKFIHITNGVTPRRWIMNANFHLSTAFTSYIGIDWLKDFSQIEKIKTLAKNQDCQKTFLGVKKINKKRLFNFLNKENPIRDYKGKIINHYSIFDEEEDILVDVQIKRFHEYKRQLLLALHAIILMQEIEKDPSSHKVKRLIVVGGKAAPGYIMAKNILSLLFSLSQKINNDPKINPYLKLAVIENYNVSKAEIIIPAADISEQISTAGMEASGTGNMKLSINGALTVGTEDGANIEMRQAIGDQWWPFSFGAKAEEVFQKKGPTSWDIYMSDEKIKKAVDTLKDGSIARSSHEHESFLAIYHSLLNNYQDPTVDKYFVIKDLPKYYEVQKKVEDLYMDKEKWAETMMNNIAGMGRFSSDEVINNYVNSIWEIEHMPLDEKIFYKIKEEFSEYQKNSY